MSGDSLGSPLSMGTEGWEPVVRAMKWREVRKKKLKNRRWSRGGRRRGRHQKGAMGSWNVATESLVAGIGSRGLAGTFLKW